MASWADARQAMHLHCEAHFIAVERWRMGGDEAVLRNRLQLLDTLYNMYKVFSAEEVRRFKFVVETDNTAFKLLDRKKPSSK